MILVNVWYGAPFFLIMYLAALKSVPEQLYEAAAIDGANWWQKIWYVTLPMMRNIISITVLFSLIVTFANFDIVRILTSGGPVDQTHIFATWAFKLGIEGNDIPLGASRVAVHVPDPRRSRRSSSCATSTSAGTRPEHGRVAAAAAGNVPPSASRQHAARPARALYLVLRLPRPVRHLLPHAADLHAHHLAQDAARRSARSPTPGGCTTRRWRTTSRCSTSEQYLTFFRTRRSSSVVVVIVTMLISVPAAFALARMKFWGSTTLATGVFLTYLIPDTLLFIPLFKIFAFVHET